MTFDEAIEKIEQLSNFEIGKTTGNIRRDLKLELGDVRDLLAELREEYAPTVEMTKVQKDTIISLLDNSDISKDDWDMMITDDSPELPEISYRQAILAYMNLETIKVVDE